jgi:serine/threonine-protein kinase
MAAPFDLIRLEIMDNPVPVVETVRQGAGSGVAQFAFSDLGSLIYVPGNLLGRDLHEHSLVWLDRDGTQTSITNEKRDYRAPRISPDGKRISLAIGDPGLANQVWIYDLEDESLNRLTFEEERSGSSVWSPDSKWLIFQSGNPNEAGMVRKPSDGSLPQERLTSTSGARQMPNSWSPDGQFIAFTEGGRPTWDIGIRPLEGKGEPEFIIATDALECCAKFSPDGKWLAYVSDESGRLQVYVRPFPGPDTKWLISEEDEGGGEPVWSPDGKELFYRTWDKMMAVSIESQDQTLRAGSPRMLFEGSYVNHSNPPGYQYYDISPDGKRFVMMTEEVETQLNVVVNWFEELKRLVPTN